MVEKRNRGKKAVDNSGSVANYKPHQSLLIRLNEDEDSRTWYGYGKNLQGRNSTIATDPPKHGEKSNLELVQKYRSLADTIYAKEVQLFGKESGVSKSDQRWIENAMRKGTLKDRIAAMSVTVSTDPVHKFYALDGLLQMAGCSDTGGQTNSRVAQLTAEAMEDLFMNTFLPPDRKLYRLNQRPLYRYETGKHSLSPKVLLLWRFEEMVKDKYEMFLSKYLSKTLQDGVEMQKVAALRSAAALLRSVPEGESQLLTMMVNKIGDPMKKTSAAAAHELRRVLQVHPAMQVVIAREVQQLAHRPQLSSRALYNCIVFLNQLKLKKEEPTAGKQTLPTSLITTYFRLFEVAVQKPKAKAKDSSGEEGMKSRLLSALL
jgi:ribosome biogenesis protein MAK21